MEIQQIKSYMKQNKITYEELSKKSNLSISTIKKIFSGISQYPRMDTMKTIENALGLNNVEFTEQEKKEFNLGDHKIALSDVDKYRLNVLARAEEVLGKEFVDAQIKLLEYATEKGMK